MLEVLGALHGEAERGGEVFLVADHDIHILRDLAVDLLGLLQAADGLPERGAVVEVVGDDGAVFVGGLDGLDGEGGGRLGKRGEDAAGVEPAHPLHPEELLPVDLAGFELRGGGVAAVGAANGTTHPETALGKVEAVAHAAADAIVGNPFDPGGVDPALEDEILDQSSDRIIGEGGDDGGAQAEAAAQAAGDVILSPALPGAEGTRGVDALLAGIEPEHHLAERDCVKSAVAGGFDCPFRCHFHP
ncbi:MAG: hypothetical protein BWY83_02261 [bacterium ADurb.Bin478]|nr:MAG: hypothetical protein BWY83_02261 [bacterium ADurb.Bin478]